MCGDGSVLLCVVCFISGLVIRCVVSVHYHCESEIVQYIPWFAVCWRLGAVRLDWSSVRSAG